METQKTFFRTVYSLEEKKCLLKVGFKESFTLSVDKNIYHAILQFMSTLEHKPLNLDKSHLYVVEIVSSPSWYSEIQRQDCPGREPGVSTVCA